MSIINTRILDLIQKKALSQKDLAKHTNVSAAAVNNWLKADRKIPADLIVPISEFLDVSPHYLLTGTEKFQSISEEDAEWLNLIHQLPLEGRLEFKGELKGYIKGYSQKTKEESGKADSSLSKAT